MLHFEAIQQLCHDRSERLVHEAEAERLAFHARARRQQCSRRWAWHAAFELLLRARRYARRRRAYA
jgi:hypothetical protein